MGRTPRGTWALSEEAAALVEYVLLIAIIALAALTGMRSLGTSSKDGMETVAKAVARGSDNPNDGKDGDSDGNAGSGNNGSPVISR